MKKILFTFLLLLFAFRLDATDLKLWYSRPANLWEEALPLGNGRLGAMVYGNPLQEVYQLNEESLWSGRPDDWNNPRTKYILSGVRQAVNEGDYDMAAQIWKNNAYGPYTARYLPLGFLKIHTIADGEIEDFYRDLDLETAMSTVRFIINGIEYTRTTFISYPDQVMVVRYKANRSGALNFNVSISSDLHHQISTVENNLLELKGEAPSFVANRKYDPNQIVYDSKKGMKFGVSTRVELKGGTITSQDTLLQVKNATEAIIYLSAGTSYNGPDKNPATEGKDFVAFNESTLSKSIAKGYAALLKSHIKDYQALFNRVQLSLTGAQNKEDLIPTDQRLDSFIKDDSDQHLIELYFQYGRYLTIASSRPGCLPANLQGIWNQHIQPPWGSNYTTNINLEMNYWPAEVTNLSECTEPLISFIGRLAKHGEVTSEVNYGIKGGWMAHHNSDAWAQTAPTGSYGDNIADGAPRWSCWPMAGIWLCQHLWEHYAFTGDVHYLRNTAYPTMKGAVVFALNWLQKDTSGYWMTNPASSPENNFQYVNAQGKKTIGEVTKGTTMDMSLMYDLFTNFLQVSSILGTDELCADVRERLTKLLPYQRGSKGQLQEWNLDFEDKDPQHRHVSHLFGLYPGKQILMRRDPALIDACKQSLAIRGDGGTGWAMAWKINLWARLQDGNHAYLMLKNGLKYVNVTEVVMKGGGTYANLFDAHPPFQIDGNFGGTAGIAEMLLQSNDGEIHILPALPDAWKTGSVSGLKTRGGFVVDMKWKDKQLTYLKITSTLGGTCVIRTQRPLTGIASKDEVTDNPLMFVGNPTRLLNASDARTEVQLADQHVTKLETKAGKSYVWKF